MSVLTTSRPSSSVGRCAQPLASGLPPWSRSEEPRDRGVAHRSLAVERACKRARRRCRRRCSAACAATSPAPPSRFENRGDSSCGEQRKRHLDKRERIGRQDAPRNAAGRQEQEHHARRRLFEELQQRVGRLAREVRRRRARTRAGRRRTSASTAAARDRARSPPRP